MKVGAARVYADIVPEKRGIVYLVGAGPGDAGLITVRGVDCLRRADVVVYDNLANPALLNHAPPHAELVYAGKKAEQHTKTQDEINDILAERAASGLTVVRLKGGDPFLFGRGGEEAGWLHDHGIDWEVVPGVTSAVAVPAYAGIPVTHRMMNGSLHVVTGHESHGVGPEMDWDVLARAGGTIVILMGVKNIGMICESLMTHGLAPETPLAMVRWGTMPEQQTMISTVAKAAQDLSESGMKPPAVCVIGEVVRLRDELAWVEQRPLFGLRVAVTRPVDENETLTTALTDLGAEAIATPTLRVSPLPANDAARKQIEALSEGKFDWLALTSANGVRQFCETLSDCGKDARSLAKCRVAVIGARTAQALQARGIRPDLVADDATQEGLAAALAEAGAKQVLIARAKVAREHLENRLRETGAQCEVLPLYETVPDEHGIARLVSFLEREKVQAITFTSARTFEALAEAVRASDEHKDGGLVKLLAGVAVAVIGPVTRQAVEDAGINVQICAERADMESLASAVVDWHKTR